MVPLVVWASGRTSGSSRYFVFLHVWSVSTVGMQLFLIFVFVPLYLMSEALRRDRMELWHVLLVFGLLVSLLCCMGCSKKCNKVEWCAGGGAEWSWFLHPTGGAVNQVFHWKGTELVFCVLKYSINTIFKTLFNDYTEQWSTLAVWVMEYYHWKRKSLQII